ncbi:MAG: aminoglycoside phosphotransferase family protein [Calditrichaeota bacterium]|nr:MAG: aminoglycoside phosphotransferase family protein [Calditrichota bacterium]
MITIKGRDKNVAMEQGATTFALPRHSPLRFPTGMVPDSQLPHLPMLLDESYMRRFFARHVGNAWWGEVRHCDILNTRYKPGKRCIVTYAVTFENLSHQHILFARLEPTCRANPSVTVWEFPEDDQLKGLAELMTSTHLPPTVAQPLGLHEQDVEIKVRPLSYVPGRQCTFVAFLRAGHGGGERVLGKAYNDDRGRSTYTRMKQLWHVHESGRDAFALTRPLAYDGARRVLWQTWTQGWSFQQYASNKGLEFACRRAATGLAGFHQLPVSGLPGSSAAHSLVKFRKRAEVLARFAPSLAQPLDELWEEIRKRLPELEAQKPCPIHGDFNASQILFDFERPVFIDLDTVCLGDPLYDVAHFISGLHGLREKSGFSMTEIKLVSQIFVRSYQESIPWPVNPKALNTQIAMALISRRAHKVLRQLGRGAVGRIESYIKLALDHLRQEGC